MHAKLLKLILPATLMSFAACADATIDSDLPPDAEDGIESSDGRADSFGVRPGTPEAEAVLAFTNQPIADNAAGAQYTALLDSALHKTAANNIAKHRAGADGTFGTADDVTFEELKQLDAVKYVGRVALMQLHDLAIAHGYGQQGASPCSDHMAPRNGTFYLRTYEDLLVIEQSRCNVFDGDVQINFSNVYMPTRGRIMTSLDAITEVHGDLTITADTSFDELAMRSLKTVNGNIRVDSYGRHHIDLNSLETATDIYLANLGSYDFAALETVPSLTFITRNDPVKGFDALQQVGHFQVNSNNSTDLVVNFPALREVAGLMTLNAPSNRATISGSFPALTQVEDLKINRLAAHRLDLGALKTVSNDIALTDVADATEPFGALEVVGRNFQISDAIFPTTGVHAGFNNLAAVGGSMFISVREGELALDAYNKLESIEEQLTITLACSYKEFKGFNKLTAVSDLNLTLGECDVDGFSVLEEVSGSVTLRNTSAMRGFDKLSVVGGNVQFTPRTDQELPVLTLVGRNFDLTTTDDVTGFNTLEIVEGNFTLRGRATKLTGFQNAEGVGGNVSLPNRMNRTDVDRFIDQLTQFSGSVTFN